MSGRILGNLDCESSFAAIAGHPAGPLPRRVLATIAGTGTLLRAFARVGDRLWLPVPVAPEAVAEVPGLPRPAVESGPLEELEPVERVLAWGATASAGPRIEIRGYPLPSLRDEEERATWELPWRLPSATPEAAATVNDRRFALELAGELGCLLPGARMVATPDELDAHLSTASVERWVLKAPFSAAGRWRAIHSGGPMDAAGRNRILRLFARHGALLFEPWKSRTADFGCAAAVTPEGVVPVSMHRLLVDATGRFRGLELVAGDRGLECPWLEPEERNRFRQVLEATGDALRRAGYSGPFGIDAWRHRLPDGGQAFHPLGEINARLTFGWVARALVDRVRGPLGLDPDQPARLMFGKRPEDRRDGQQVPLLHAPDSGDPEIRLEIGYRALDRGKIAG